MASGWQGVVYSKRYGRELVSKPAIPLKKSWGLLPWTLPWNESFHFQFGNMPYLQQLAMLCVIDAVVVAVDTFRL